MMEIFDLKIKLRNYLTKQTEGDIYKAYFILKTMVDDIYDEILTELEDEDEDFEDDDGITMMPEFKEINDLEPHEELKEENENVTKSKS